MIAALLKRVGRTESDPVPRVDGAARLPRTQDQVMVVAAHAERNVLALRDGSVVAAVGVSSVDDALLTPLELQSRLGAFRDDLLKRLRFDVQVLIGTRPQDLERYHRQLERQVAHLAGREARLIAMRERLDGYWGEDKHVDRTIFAAHFGFDPDELEGIPGMAHEAAWELCQDETARLWQAQPPALRESMTAGVRAAVESSIEALAHWQDVLYERSAFVESAVQALQAPVRTLYLVTSFNPRLIAKAVRSDPLTERELERACQELDQRCDQLLRGVGRMKLPAWRASSEELLNEVRHFYHPSQAQLSRKRIE